MRRKMAPHEVQAELLKALAHPFRLQLLRELAKEEECVCHLAALFEKPQPYVSQQLGELKDADLVQDRRDGQRTFYRLTDHRIVPLLTLVQEMTGSSQVERSGPRERLRDCPCPKCN